MSEKPLSVIEIENKVRKKYANNPGRLNHILGVRELACELARKYGVDLYQAEVAALLHDYYKYESIEEMLQVIDSLEIAQKYQYETVQYHAYASAAAAQKEFYITDSEIIKAIQHHVYGSFSMGMLEKIILISDFAESNRPYPRCKEVRKILLEGAFHFALEKCLEYTIQTLIELGITPSAEQIKIYETLKGNNNE